MPGDDDDFDLDTVLAPSGGEDLDDDGLDGETVVSLAEPAVPQPPTRAPQPPASSAVARRPPAPVASSAVARRPPAPASPSREQSGQGAAPAPARRATALARTDIVPEFRRDLELTRSDGGYKIVDPLTGGVHSLNEYEVSLARMLNGQRPVFEVIESVDRLGIPVNIESLQKFIALLEGYGFLRPPTTIDAAVDGALDRAWPSRGEWDSSVRTLFQSGIRLLRMGKHQEAAGYFEALLAEDPDNVEAKELLALANQPSPTAPTLPQPVPPYDARLAAMPPPHDPRFSAQRAVPTYDPHAYELQQAAQPQQPTYPPAAYPPPMPAQRHLPVIWRVALVAAILVIGGLVGYIVMRGSKRESTPLRDARAAADADAQVPGGRVVDVAPAVVPVDAPVPQAATAEVDAMVAAVVDAAVDAPVRGDAAIVASDAGAKQSIPTHRTVTLDRVPSPANGDVISFLLARRKVAKGEKLFAIVADSAQVKAANVKVGELTTLAKQDSVYDAFLADAKAELARLRKAATTVVTATRAGIATPNVKTGDKVTAGQALAEIQ